MLEKIRAMKRFFILLFLFPVVNSAQSKKETNAVDVNIFRGNVMLHTDDLGALQGHAQAVMINFSRQTHGELEWQKAYNYPDYGAFLLYQNYNNDILGKIYSAGMNYNFYFLNRNLMFKIGQGLAYATSPYNKDNNSKNKSFGSEILANTNMALFYKRENIVDNFGIQAGFLFTHFSNGRIKSPNSGINTYGFDVGINYNFEKKQPKVVDTVKFSNKMYEPIKYNFVFRSGVNESTIIGSGRHPFYHLSAYADKRLNRKSALQLGTDVFLTTSFIDYIKYISVAYPDKNLNPNTDYKRVGVFAGHELFINKFSVEFQIGYYVYQPFKNDLAIYDRLGAKYYFNKNVFTSFHIKTHLFLAEALEFGVGCRL